MMGVTERLIIKQCLNPYLIIMTILNQLTVMEIQCLSIVIKRLIWMCLNTTIEIMKEEKISVLLNLLIIIRLIRFPRSNNYFILSKYFRNHKSNNDKYPLIMNKKKKNITNRSLNEIKDNEGYYSISNIFFDNLDRLNQLKSIEDWQINDNKESERQFDDFLKQLNKLYIFILIE